jgi:hypothetical protein
VTDEAKAMAMSEATGMGGTGGMSATAADALRVVRGEPTPEELAALVAVLAVRPVVGEPDEAAATRPMSGWTERARYVRPGRPEFGARAGWRASALPR